MRFTERLPDELAVSIPELMAMKRNVRSGDSLVPRAYPPQVSNLTAKYPPPRQVTENMHSGPPSIGGGPLRVASAEMVPSTCFVPFRMLKLKVELLNIVAILPNSRLKWYRPRQFSATENTGRSTEAKANGVTVREDEEDENDSDRETARVDQADEEGVCGEGGAMEEELSDSGLIDDNVAASGGEGADGSMQCDEEGADESMAEENVDMPADEGAGEEEGEEDEGDPSYSTDDFVSAVQDADSYEEMMYLLNKFEKALTKEALPVDHDGQKICNLSGCAADIALRLYSLDRAVRYEDIALNVTMHSVDYRPRIRYTPRCVMAPECSRCWGHSGKCDSSFVAHESRYHDAVESSSHSYSMDTPAASLQSVYFPPSMLPTPMPMSLDAIQPYVPRADEIADDAWI